MTNSTFQIEVENIKTDMLTHTYRSFIVFILFLFIVSCNKNESPGISPTIVLLADSGFVSNSISASPGELLSFKVELQEGSEKITNFYIELFDINQTSTRYFDTSMYVSDLVWTGSFYKSTEPIESWNFIVKDRQGGSGISTLEISADTNSVYEPIDAFENIVLGAQNNLDTGGFYSFTTQLIHFADAAKNNQELIDLVYYYYLEDENTIASPGANIEDGIFPEDLTPVNWEIRNTTRYIKTALTQEDFENTTNDSILIANYIDAEGKRKAKNLVVGDIYVFKNQQSRLGMFYVNSVDGTDEGLIDIDVKIQSDQK